VTVTGEQYGDEKKYKMGITEKESIELEHKYKVRRILLDKLLLGIVLLLLGI
jgi:hypothetical protein